MLGREWNGQMHRVAVLTEGFALDGKTHRSLTKVAFAITGTRWSGPKFFGLRDRRSKGSASFHPADSSDPLKPLPSLLTVAAHTLRRGRG